MRVYERSQSEGTTLFQKSAGATKLDPSISMVPVNGDFQSSSFVSILWDILCLLRAALGGDNYPVGSNLQHGSLAALDISETNFDFMESDTLKPFIIPIVGLLAGFAMMTVPKVATVGKLVLYFGAQSSMNIFMGWILRTRVTVAKGKIPGANVELDEDLHGCPAGFAVTAMQQVISFSCFLILFAALYATPYKILPKKISTLKEVVSILIFGCVFALNIAFNNFSLGYISLAANLIIRSCLPLTTYLSQQAFATVKLYQKQPVNWLDISLMVVGVFCACAFTWATIMGSGGGHSGSSHQARQILGCVMCLLSLLCGSVSLALAGVLGEMKLSVYDTVAYMSVPACLFLIPFCLVKKPVPGAWRKVLGMDTASDLDILMMTRNVAPITFELFILSGFFSFAYNIIQFSIVRSLDPAAAAFGGDFNKTALVFLTLLLPFLRVHSLPPAPWNIIIWTAVVGNVAAFCCYSYLRILAKQTKAAEDASKSKDETNKAKSQAMLQKEQT